MEKLAEYLLQTEVAAQAQPTVPMLSVDEQKDVLSQLGLEHPSNGEQEAMDLIMAKMAHVREFSLATGDAAKEAENDEDYADYGTVIIKTKSGKSKQGTLRLKKGDDRFGSIIFRGGDVESQDLPSDAFSTMRVIETRTGDDDYRPPWASAQTSSAGDSKPANEASFLWRAPEEWEVNIIALERGEWAENMSEDAFRKYKKERPKLGGIFRGESHFFNPDAITAKMTTASAPVLLTPTIETASPRDAPLSARSSSPTIDHKHDAAHHHHLSKSADKVSRPKSDKKSKSKDKSKDKKDKEKEKEKDAQKERKWAVFKRTSEARQKLADS